MAPSSASCCQCSRSLIRCTTACRAVAATAGAPASFFFQKGELEYDTKTLLGKKLAGAPAVAATALQTVVQHISSLEHWQHEALEGAIRPQAEELGMKTGELFGLIRVAVTGRTAAPPLFETMAVLGRERSLERLESALRRLQYWRPGRHRPKGGS